MARTLNSETTEAPSPTTSICPLCHARLMELTPETFCSRCHRWTSQVALIHHGQIGETLYRYPATWQRAYQASAEAFRAEMASRAPRTWHGQRVTLDLFERMQAHFQIAAATVQEFTEALSSLPPPLPEEIETEG